MHFDRSVEWCIAWLATFFFVGAAIAAPAPRPAELDALLTRGRVEGLVTAWCAGVFEAGGRGAYAVAVKFPTRESQYLVLGVKDAPVVLASFAGVPDLACYSAAEAKALDKSIARSTTIHGSIAPRWNTTVVCGFVEPTNARCWQYSPPARAFVKVGEWVT